MVPSEIWCYKPSKFIFFFNLTVLHMHTRIIQVIFTCGGYREEKANMTIKVLEHQMKKRFFNEKPQADQADTPSPQTWNRI